MSKSKNDKYVERYLNNFSLIKKATGWNAETFADKCCTTRQTINNMELRKYNLSKILYKCMRYALLDEITKDPKGTVMIKVLLDVLVDDPEKYSKHDINEIVRFSELVVPAINHKIGFDRTKVCEEWIKVLTKVHNIDISSISNSINIKEWIHK